MSLDEAIDREILGFFEGHKWQTKVARVIGEVLGVLERDHPEIGESMVTDRIYILVENGNLIGFGNIKKWRTSEVKLAEHMDEADK